MFPTWISVGLDGPIFWRARLKLILFSISKCSLPQSPWIGGWTTWHPTLTHPRRVVEGSQSTLPHLTGNFLFLTLWWDLYLHMHMVRPGGPLTPSKNSSGVFGSLERGLDKMKNMLTPRLTLNCYYVGVFSINNSNHSLRSRDGGRNFGNNWCLSRKSRGAGDGPVTVSGKGLFDKTVFKSLDNIYCTLFWHIFLKQVCATFPPPPTTTPMLSSTSWPGPSCSRWYLAIHIFTIY